MPEDWVFTVGKEGFLCAHVSTNYEANDCLGERAFWLAKDICKRNSRNVDKAIATAQCERRIVKRRSKHPDYEQAIER